MEHLKTLQFAWFYIANYFIDIFQNLPVLLIMHNKLDGRIILLFIKQYKNKYIWQH